MSALAIIRSARAAGVELTVTATGRIKATGHSNAVARWVPALTKHKPEIVAALSAAETPVIEHWEERAAHLEYEAGLPRSWAEPFAKILCSGPFGDFDHTRWMHIINGALLFGDEWGAKAHALGWTADDAFGMHPFAPAARRDAKGIAWFLGDGARVIAIDADGADIITARRAKQRFYRRKPGQ